VVALSLHISVISAILYLVSKHEFHARAFAEHSAPNEVLCIAESSEKAAEGIQ
jgi:hypothetical protein